MSYSHARASQSIVGVVDSSHWAHSARIGHKLDTIEYAALGSQRLKLNEEIRNFRRGVSSPSRETSNKQPLRPSFRSHLVKQHPVATSFDESQIAKNHQCPGQRRPVLRSVTSAHHPIEVNEDMAPRIVHKQYNSPIDLYSMNNIRKTIEAHTEMIAPGVKGINFMKAETPINKQSEVYKLVMEEEHKRHSDSQQQDAQAASGSRLSPISGRPMSIPSAMATADEIHLRHAQSVGATKARHVNFENQQQLIGARYEAQQHRQEQREHQDRAQPATGTKSSAPHCCECGQVIVGHYAKIHDRSVHPNCFNCSTCGTSLKNTGYFTINDKLYCEIHARQMANIMRIKYDFESHTTQQTRANTQAHQNEQRQQVGPTLCTSSAQTREQVTQHQHSQQNRHEAQHRFRTPAVDEDHNGFSTAAFSQQTHGFAPPSGTPATISTMFADRGRSFGDASSSSSSTRLTTTENYSDSFAARHNRQQTHAMVNLSQLQTENRVPVCAHCQLQIHGPYVLADRTAWCKPCSQVHFVCRSCRRSLLDVGFIEDSSGGHYCEFCFEAQFAPSCAKCNLRIRGDCLNALAKKWHPSCFVCGHCQRPFGNSSFYLEDGVPYCERDWNLLFTTKCFQCALPIEAGDKWVEALGRNYHSTCFSCSTCHQNLEGSTFYCKGGRPYCRLHAR